MKINSLGATHFSGSLFKIKKEVQLRHYDVLYLIEQDEGESIIIANDIYGYIELPMSFLKVIQENLKQHDSIFSIAINDYNASYLLDIILDKELTTGNELREISKKIEALFLKIDAQVKRAAKSMFLNLYKTCFLSHIYPSVYLTKEGFYFEKVDEVLGYTTRTIRDNLDKLKKIGIINYKFSKNSISHLQFNLAQIPLIEQKIPSIFKTAFYYKKELSDFEPINNSLKKIENQQIIFDKQHREVDYIEKQKLNTEIGAKSEQIALEFEYKRLKASNIQNPENYAKIVSENSSLGYDIVSIESESFEKRYIEVKTVKKTKDLHTFYLTSNELHKSKVLADYYLYFVVYNKADIDVKILKASNLDESEYIDIVPINYKVSFKI